MCHLLQSGSIETVVQRMHRKSLSVLLRERSLLFKKSKVCPVPFCKVQTGASRLQRQRRGGSCAGCKGSMNLLLRKVCTCPSPLSEIPAPMFLPLENPHPTSDCMGARRYCRRATRRDPSQITCCFPGPFARFQQDLKYRSIALLNGRLCAEPRVCSGSLPFQGLRRVQNPKPDAGRKVN